MSRKPILIAVTIIVLALGAIGAAFATSMDFSNVGALSSGKADLAQVNTDDVGFLSADDGSGVDRVALSFDRDLAAGSTIWVTVEFHGCPKVDGEAHGWKVLDSDLDKDDEVIIELDETLEIEDFGESYNVKVAVAER